MPNSNRRTHEFKVMQERLPLKIQSLADKAFALFEHDPNYSSLRHHALKDNARGQHRNSSYSVSITMQYRAIYVESGAENIWYWIGSHSDYDSFVGGD